MIDSFQTEHSVAGAQGQQGPGMFLPAISAYPTNDLQLAECVTISAK
jgi:hypothetical protein